MPKKVNLMTPPNLRGTAEEQCRQLYSYLYQMVDLLNVNLNSLDEQNMSEDVQKKLNTVYRLAEETEAAKRSASGQVSALDRSTSLAISDAKDALQNSINTNVDDINVRVDEVERGLNKSIDELRKSAEEKNYVDVYAPLQHMHYASDLRDVQIRAGDGLTISMTTRYKDAPVVFDTPFPDDMDIYVVACIRTRQTDYNLGSYTLTVLNGSITTEGFSVRAFRDSSEEISFTYSYIAIGLPRKEGEVMMLGLDV